MKILGKRIQKIVKNHKTGDVCPARQETVRRCSKTRHERGAQSPTSFSKLLQLGDKGRHDLGSPGSRGTCNPNQCIESRDVIAAFLEHANWIRLRGVRSLGELGAPPAVTEYYCQWFIAPVALTFSFLPFFFSHFATFSFLFLIVGVF